MPTEAKPRQKATKRGAVTTGEWTLASKLPRPTDLPLRKWDALAEALIKDARRSERLTKEDLAIRINARA